MAIKRGCKLHNVKHKGKGATENSTTSSRSADFTRENQDGHGKQKER